MRYAARVMRGLIIDYARRRQARMGGVSERTVQRHGEKARIYLHRKGRASGI